MLEQLVPVDDLGPDEPRSKSVWMRPAACGAFDPARNVQARDSLSPVVKNVRSPSRW